MNKKTDEITDQKIDEGFDMLKKVIKIIECPYCKKHKWFPIPIENEDGTIQLDVDSDIKNLYINAICVYEKCNKSFELTIDKELKDAHYTIKR